MAQRISTFLNSMRLQSQGLGVSRVGSPTGKNAFDRLSSGQQAIDKPADTVLRARLKSEMRVSTAAITNASSGLTITSVADKALREISGLLGQMYDLADRSASNSLLTNEDRAFMQEEFSAMAVQIQGITRETITSGFNPLSGGSNIVLQLGPDGSTGQFSLQGGKLDLAALNLTDSNGALVNAVTEPFGDKSPVQNLAKAMEIVDAQRQAFRATENRLEVSIANLSSTREGLAAVEQGIQSSTDAQSAAQQSRSEILKDVGAALLAQANVEPISAATLLEGSAFEPAPENSRGSASDVRAQSADATSSINKDQSAQAILTGLNNRNDRKS